jgi:hypothetical protein
MTHIKSDLLKAEKSRSPTLIRENSDSAKKSDRAHAYIITRMITKFERRRINEKKTRCFDSKKNCSHLTINRQRKKRRTINFERFVICSDNIFFIAY